MSLGHDQSAQRGSVARSSLTPDVEATRADGSNFFTGATAVDLRDPQVVLSSVLLRDLVNELGIGPFAYLTAQMYGALGYRLREFVEANPAADVDLQLEVTGGEAFVGVLGVKGEAVVHESTVALGVLSAMSERAQVILELWRLEQGRRARAVWLRGVDRKIADLGIRDRTSGR